jgi:hypothetical protein
MTVGTVADQSPLGAAAAQGHLGADTGAMKDLAIPQVRQFLRWVNSWSIALLGVAYVGTQILRHVFDRDLGGEHGLIQVFDLRVERNLPTVYSTLLLALAALVVFLVAVRSRGRGDSDFRRWGILSLVLLFLSVDETAALHERWTFLIREYINPTGILHDAWVIPFAGILVVLAAYFWPFLKRLPADTRNRFILAGAVFVGGAFGMELVEGYYESCCGTWVDAPYAFMAGIEELSELIGMAIFVDAVLRHLNLRLGVQSIKLTEAA